MDKHPPVVAEFSRLVAVDRLEQGEITETLAASDEECRALARRFGLVALTGLRAEVTAERVGREPLIRVEGRFVADVVQTCVVSLEPVSSRLEEAFVLHFAREGRSQPEAPTAQGHVVQEGVGESDEDWPEPIQDGRIDIGEAVAQQLALALDPYPRKPGVQLEDVIGPREGWSIAESATSPFAVLARLSRRNS